MKSPARLFLTMVLTVVSLAFTNAALSQTQFREERTDRPGSDYRRFELGPPAPNTFADNASNCQSSCQRDGKCAAWTYVEPGVQGPQGVCYLKSAIPQARPNNCCTSGVNTRPTETNVDRPGNDYARLTIGDLPIGPSGNTRLTAAWCRAKCEADSSCDAWTFVRPGVQGPGPVCYLKRPLPAANNNGCCTSGVPFRPPVIK